MNDVAVTDLNHDGRPDLAIPERALDTLAIFTQMVTGSFPAKPTARYYLFGWPHTVVPVAMNGYGVANVPAPVADDLVVGARNISGGLYILDNTGTAPGELSLVPRPVIHWSPNGGTPSPDPRLVTAPLNGDRYADIGYLLNPATGKFGVGGLAILPTNNPATDLGATFFFQTTRRPVDISVADMLTPGDYDALVASPTTNEVIMVQGRGNTTPSNSWWGYQIKLASFGVNPVAAAGGDVNGDGRPDLVAAHETNPNVVVQFRDPSVFDQVLFLANRVTYPLPGPPRQVVLQDLNGDARPELIVLLTSGIVEVFRNTGQSGQALFDAPILLPTGLRPAYLRLADINADGQLDFAVACPGDNTVHLFYNQSIILSTKTAKTQLGVSVYPNPAQTTLHIRSDHGAPINAATLLDALGRPVRRWLLPTASVDVSAVPRGIYLLQVQSAAGVATRRIVLE